MILLEKCYKDSDGFWRDSKRSFFHGVPCITIRKETEWVELLETGDNELTSSNIGKITTALNKEFSFSNKNIYGDSNASNKIINLITSH